MPKTLILLLQFFVLSTLALVWLTVGMVYTERFIPPFDKSVQMIMPWKDLVRGPLQAGSVERFLSMEKMLEESRIVSNSSFILMISSFCLLTLYFTFIYQQKQRRSRENTLLHIKNQEIARRNEFIQYLTATIGHEFKNNLGRIKRRIDLLLDIPQEQKQHIDHNLKKLFTDIDIFKDISDKREAGLAEFAKIDLMKNFNELSEQNNDLATVDIDTSFRPPPILASSTLLKTVLENLIDNAIKYKKKEQTHAHISISFSMDRDGDRQYITLSFKDKGIGMDAWTADQCFYKSRATHDGWGKGLYFAKYVIRLHAGRIRVGKEYTALEVGTEIIINLPFIEEEDIYV